MSTYDTHKAAVESSRGNAGGNAASFGRYEAAKPDVSSLAEEDGRAREPILLEVVRAGSIDTTNDGVSNRFAMLQVVAVGGRGNRGTIEVDSGRVDGAAPVVLEFFRVRTGVDRLSVRPLEIPENCIGPMFGGNKARGDRSLVDLVASSWPGVACDGTVFVHDRFEASREYRAQSSS